MKRNQTTVIEKNQWLWARRPDYNQFIWCTSSAILNLAFYLELSGRWLLPIDEVRYENCFSNTIHRRFVVKWVYIYVWKVVVWFKDKLELALFCSLLKTGDKLVASTSSSKCADAIKTNSIISRFLQIS